MLDAPSGPDDGLAPIPLDSDGQRVLDGLLALAEALHLAAPEAAAIYDVPVDLYAEDIAELAEATALMRRGAERLALLATGSDAGAELGLASLHRQLQEAAETLRLQNTALNEDDPADAAEAASGAAYFAAEDVAYAIREHALERNHDILFEFAPDGRPSLLGASIPAATAHVWLLERVMQRLERASSITTLASLERAAARWWFSRWSAHVRGSLFDGETFTQEVREHEWSLTERIMVEDNTSVLNRVIYSPAWSALPPYQQALTHALRRGRTGVFHVRHIRGNVVTVEEGGSHTRLDMHEHRTPVDYEAGCVLLGRVMPLRSGEWIRSPGALIVAPPDPLRAEEYVSSLVHALEAAAPTMSRGIALEAILSTAIGLAPVPLDVPPAPSPEAARLLEETVFKTLREAGLCQVTSPDDVPTELAERMRADGGRNLEAVSLQVDELIGAWMMALHEQGERNSSSSRAHGSGRKPSKGKRRRKRR